MEIVIVFRSIFPMNNFEKIKNKKQKLKCTSNALQFSFDCFNYYFKSRVHLKCT